MEYKFQDELLEASEEFIRLLKDVGIDAAIIDNSFRDYTVKLSISHGDKSSGKVNIYYSPKKDSYSLGTHGLKDKSVIPKLEECWNSKFLASDGSNGQGYEIYVDGSFLNGSAGYGIVILRDGQVIEELSGSVSDTLAQGTRNIAGELAAAEKAIEWCQENSVAEVSIFYDLRGIEKWATRKWKTNAPLTRRYAELVSNCGVQIHWHKVDGHTGNRWNERADELAKSGVASLSPKPGSDELESEAKGFVEFLDVHGYEAELKGIYGNSDCARIGISQADEDIGHVNIYITKKVPFLPRYHELKDQTHRDKLELLWREYHYGERQLSLGL